MTGWNLPPGVNVSDIDRAAGGDDEESDAGCPHGLTMDCKDCELDEAGEDYDKMVDLAQLLRSVLLKVHERVENDLGATARVALQGLRPEILAALDRAQRELGVVEQ